ncbi:MAG: MFS transporter [Rhodopila sp.]|jgi:MFS family permease
MQRDAAGSIESRASWHAAFLTLAILSVSFGAPLIVVVGLRDIQTAMHTDRSVLSLASALVWIGTGLGGIAMGWLADRIGIRRTVAVGTLMMAAGLALSSLGTVWALFVGHGMLIGFFGNGAIFPPLMIYVSRWFDRRRGTAIALISSGQYIAGVIWPSIQEVAIKQFGWQPVMLCFAAVVLLILPALTLLHPAPDPLIPGLAYAGPRPGEHTTGLRPNVAMVLLCIASFCCCVPMAVPFSQLVAFCGDIGIPPSHGAAMLSVMLGCAFLTRQFWGAFADRFGGLRTIMTGSALQMFAIGAFLLTQDEVGLFAIVSAFGLGFSGIIPSYSVTIRDLYPSKEASWRIPTVLMTAMSGMAFGNWFAGKLFDELLSYRPAFASGVLFNLANLFLIVFLVSRVAPRRRVTLATV